MGDQIVVKEVPGEGFFASVDGIHCAGLGPTEADAIRSLASVLSDFVKGHAATINAMRDNIRALAAAHASDSIS